MYNEVMAKWQVAKHFTGSIAVDFTRQGYWTNELFVF